MITSADNFVGLSYHEVFYTDGISHCHYQWVSKLSVYLNLTTIGRLIMIWDEVLFKLRVSFEGMIIMNKVFLDSRQHIKTHINVVVEVIVV